TLLRNGKVLVVGGSTATPGYFLASAELYDPAAGTWKTTGSLSTGRYAHTATLLPNGKVLVVGGWRNGGGGVALATTELYDPATGTWSLSGPINLGRAVPTATLLPGGKVLLAGGEGSSGWVAVTELYDPAAGKWTTIGSLSYPRWSHTATLLVDGKVLLAGGNTNGFYPTIGELFGVDLGFMPDWQPQIATVNSPLSLGDNLALTGSGFRGVSEGSCGNSQDSAADYPLVQLRSLESGQTTFLLSADWQTNSFTSAPVWGFPPGYALATVFVNGIPSTGSVINISVPVPTTATLTDAKRLTNGACQFCFTNIVGALFGVLATTNPALPLSNWTALGGATEVCPGQFQFTDPQATNTARRFYRLRSL